MHLRVLFDEKVRDVNLFQRIAYSKVNTVHLSREGNVPNAPGGVDEIWARVFGAIDIDRPTEPQNYVYSRREQVDIPEETPNFPLP